MANRPTVTLMLTPAQQAQVKQTTGKDVSRLTLESLEPRLAPGIKIN